MQIPVHLSGKGIDLTPGQEALIREEVARLEKFFDRLVACRVVVTVPHRRPGRDPVAWTVRLALTVPGEELAIDRKAGPSFREAVEDAFAAARRRLQDYARFLRGDVKRPAPASLGVVIAMYTYEGYGFIRAEDGRGIYFHRNAVADDGFDELSIGMPVRFVESEGEEGPQASTVLPAGHIVAVPPEPKGELPCR